MDNENIEYNDKTCIIIETFDENFIKTIYYSISVVLVFVNDLVGR